MTRDELLQQLANAQYPKRGEKMDATEINKILKESKLWEGRFLDEDLKDPIVKLRNAIANLIEINEKLTQNCLAYSKAFDQLKAKIEEKKHGTTG